MDKQEYNKKYYQEHKEEHKQRMKKWYEKNKEKIKQTTHNWYVKNKEHHYEKMNEWRKNNKKHFCELVMKSKNLIEQNTIKIKENIMLRTKIIANTKEDMLKSTEKENQLSLKLEKTVRL